METLLISRCLLGEPVRYNGCALGPTDTLLETWMHGGRVVPFCPEVAAGMPIPRPPAEISGGDGDAVLEGNALVLDTHGKQVSAPFLRGARIALDLCRKHGIRLAILAESSPSCGVTTIYDGTFSGKKIPGSGVTTALLRRNGILVFSQHQLDGVRQALGAG